jgi:NAD(P)-dependent dehydrogenase (short-subunit alcohol dehydrogenase family)
MASMVLQSLLLLNAVVMGSGSMQFVRKFPPWRSEISGPIDTAIFRDCEVKGMVTEQEMAGVTLLGRMGHPKEVAQVIVFLLSDKSSYVTGGISQQL